jgi:hypothetical protein
MIKQSITYENFDGEMVTEDHYFHLSKSELIDMELGADGGMSAKLKNILASNNGAEIMKIFKEIVAKAYGQRVDGSGSEFYKTDELAARFMGSLAFDAFLTTLLTDVTVAVKFVNGVIPKDLQATADVRSALAAQRTADVALPGVDGKPDIRPSGLNNPLDAGGSVLPWAFREPTADEMMAMNQSQLQDVYRRKSSGWAPLEPASM